jgi:hypothetical protein
MKERRRDSRRRSFFSGLLGIPGSREARRIEEQRTSTAVIAKEREGTAKGRKDIVSLSSFRFAFAFLRDEGR